MPSPFTELAAVLAIAAAAGAVGTLLRQPLIVSFIFAGILVGPSGFGLLRMTHELELLADVGIAVLLFVVGLKLDLTIIRTMGLVSAVTGIGQVVFTSVFGFLICLGLGMAWIPSVYVAVALTFSSTIIIVKLLSDKREIDSLHGRIAVGFLIVQDIVVVLTMVALSALGAGTGSGAVGAGAIAGEVLGLLGKIAIFLVGIALAARFILPPFTARLARSPELLLTFAISWAVALAAGGELLGFSREVGAFLAGVSLASSPFRETLSGRLVTLRDFLLLFFFINLGASLELGALGDRTVAAVILSVFVLVGNPLIVMVLMGVMGYRKRTGFLAGLTVAQISEFSLILGALGVSLGHIDRETLGLITLVGLITIGLSTYLILYSHPIYGWIERFLDPFERKVPHREGTEPEAAGERFDVVLFGIGRYGSRIAAGLRSRGVAVLEVDFDPEALQRAAGRGEAIRYADATDPHAPEALPLAGARWVACAAPDLQANLTLLNALREHGFPGRVAVTAHTPEDAARLEAAGANLVLQPFRDAADLAATALAARG
jgi:Kef-type K+ transport system membrane component KefB